MRVKSNFLSKNAKLAFGLIAMCGVLFTSCYEKDDNLDVNPPIVTPEAATYSLVGDVTNYLGEAVNATAELSGVANSQSGVSFGFADLQPGSYTLTISADEYQSVTKNVIISQVSAGQHSITRADVTLAKTTSEIESVLATYKVQGLIKDQKTGATIAGAIVKYGTVEATSTDNGTYSLANELAAGTYVVTIEAADYPIFMSEVQLTEAYYDEAKVINKVFNFDINKADVIVDTYSVKATAEDPAVLFVLYNANTNEEVESGRGSLDYMALAGSYYIKATKENEIINISKVFTLGANASQSFAWSVAKEKETGSTIVITDPTVEVKDQLVENEAEDAVSALIQEVSVTIPANALNEPTALNIRIIPTNTDVDPTSIGSVLSFRGTPSGTIFNTPLEVTFADEFGLGNMKLFYLTNGSWVIEEGDNGNVISENGYYTAKIPHFSEFQFGFNFTASSLNDSFESKSGEGNIINNTGSNKTVTASYLVFKGARFTEDLGSVLSNVTDKPAGIELMRAIITNLIRYQYGVTPGDDFTEETVTKDITIPAGYALTEATATQEKTIQTYVVDFSHASSVTINVEIAGTSILDQIIETIGHGHDNSWNSGGGISVAE